MKKQKFPAFIFIIAMFVTLACSGGGSGSGGGDDNRIKDTVAGVDFYLRYVPDGTFTVQSGGRPQMTITTGYWMAETEVTQDLWKAVMTGSANNATPSSFKSSPATNEEQGKRPVENITWFDAIEFCNKLSEKTNKSPAYNLTVKASNRYKGSIVALATTVTIIAGSTGYRLPTEMEWMWAAMGAENPSGGYAKKYAGGGTENTVGIELCAWYSGNSLTNRKTHEVGLLEANELGLYDMSGNVVEWCYDQSKGSGYPTTMPDDYSNSTGNARVIRGGSYNDAATNCTVAYRRFMNPGMSDINIGFRVMCP